MVVVVIMERIADHVRVLEVLEQLFFRKGSFVGFSETLVPAWIDLKSRWWLASKLRYISTVTVHVVVTNHDARLLGHISLMTFNSFRVMTYLMWLAEF